MNTMSLDMSLEQIRKAMRRLPAQEKIALWRLLDEEIDRAAIEPRFSNAVNDIRKAYAQIGEEQVMADAVNAVRQVRKARHDSSRS